jgi:hypothetical protein
VYEDTEYAWVKLTDLDSTSVSRGAMGRGYPFHGMSARMLSIESRTTLQSFGGPEGLAAVALAEADASGAADATPEAAGALPDAAGCVSVCAVDGIVGGASFEQATSASPRTTAAGAREVRTRP